MALGADHLAAGKTHHSIHIRSSWILQHLEPGLRVYDRTLNAFNSIERLRGLLRVALASSRPIVHDTASSDLGSGRKADFRPHRSEFAQRRTEGSWTIFSSGVRSPPDSGFADLCSDHPGAAEVNLTGLHPVQSLAAEGDATCSPKLV